MYESTRHFPRTNHITSVILVHVVIFTQRYIASARRRLKPARLREDDPSTEGNLLITGNMIPLGEKVIELAEDQSQLDVPFDRHDELNGNLNKHCMLAEQTVPAQNLFKREIPDIMTKEDLAVVYGRLIEDVREKLLVPANLFDDPKALLNPDNSWVHGDDIFDGIDSRRLLKFCDVTRSRQKNMRVSSLSPFYPHLLSYLSPSF